MKRYKYPKTMHVPWSEALQNDDRLISNMDAFIGKEVIVSEKMDGENATMYHDFIHARSIEGNYHPSRDWVRAFWGAIRHQIPEGWRICGENLYARHSITYQDLPTYFMGFNMWEGNTCFSWDETLDYFEMLGITPVPVLYRGEYNESLIKALYDDSQWDSREGYVVRLAGRIEREEWGRAVGKFVRKNHVQSSNHWLYEAIKPNGLRKD